MLLKMKNRKGFTLVEVLIAFLVLVVGITGVYMLYINSAYFTNESNRIVIATREGTAMMEMLKSMSLAEIRAERANDDFWDDNLANVLPSIDADVSNIDGTDNDWLNDPLELEVKITWVERGAQKNITMMSAFTDE